MREYWAGLAAQIGETIHLWRSSARKLLTKKVKCVVQKWTVFRPHVGMNCRFTSRAILCILPQMFLRAQEHLWKDAQDCPRGEPAIHANVGAKYCPLLHYAFHLLCQELSCAAPPEVNCFSDLGCKSCPVFPHVFLSLCAVQ